MAANRIELEIVIDESQSQPKPMTPKAENDKVELRVYGQEYQDDDQTAKIIQQRYSSNVDKDAKDKVEVTHFKMVLTKKLAQAKLSKKELHPIEKEIFEKVFEFIQDKKKVLEKTIIVLVDVFTRHPYNLSSSEPPQSSSSAVDSKQAGLQNTDDARGPQSDEYRPIINNGYPDTHTICFWYDKNTKKFAYMDPSNIEFTEWLEQPLKNLFSELAIKWLKDSLNNLSSGKANEIMEFPAFITLISNVNLQRVTVKDKERFYECALSEHYHIREECGKRDCVDIATKVAFVLQENCNLPQDDIIKKIAELSNNSKINSFLPSQAHGICMRELQSSKKNERAEALNYLKECKDKLNAIKNIKDIKVRSNKELKELMDVLLSAKSQNKPLIHAYSKLEAAFLRNLNVLKLKNDDKKDLNDEKKDSNEQNSEPKKPKKVKGK
jgi:hypothetical protein